MCMVGFTMQWKYASVLSCVHTKTLILSSSPSRQGPKTTIAFLLTILDNTIYLLSASACVCWESSSSQYSPHLHGPLKVIRTRHKESMTSSHSGPYLLSTFRASTTLWNASTLEDLKFKSSSTRKQGVKFTTVRAFLFLLLDGKCPPGQQSLLG